MFDRIAPKYDLINLVERSHRKRSYSCYVASDGKSRVLRRPDQEEQIFKGTVHVVQDDIVHGEFFEHFELRSFPFDLQSLSVRVRAREDPTVQQFVLPCHDGVDGRPKSDVWFDSKRDRRSTFSGSSFIIPEW